MAQAQHFDNFVLLFGDEPREKVSMAAICFSFAEVTNINRRGFWLQVGDEELYLSFDEFPRFGDATVEQICRVESPCASHLYWPGLGIDLSLEAIRNPLAASHHRPQFDC
jgi:hypothetical protein